MKKLLFTLLLFPLFLNAQIDSSLIKISPSIQARDIEFLVIFISANEIYEDVWDGIKTKFRVNNPPTNQDLVVLDTVSLRYLFDFYNYLTNHTIAIKKNALSRVETILRATNQPWLINKINAATTSDDALYTSIRQAGRNRARKIRN